MSYRVCLHTPPTAHNKPYVRSFASLVDFFEWHNLSYRNHREVVNWIKDEEDAVHFGHIHNKSGRLLEEITVGWSGGSNKDNATLHRSTAYKAARAESELPVQVKLAE